MVLSVAELDVGLCRVVARFRRRRRGAGRREWNC